MDDRETSKGLIPGFDGRIGRAGYWQAIFLGPISCLLLLSGLALALGLLFGIGVRSVHVGLLDIFGNPSAFPFNASFSDPGSTSRTSLVSTLFYAGGTPIFLATFWYLACATLRRIHDRDRSGWWLVPFVIAPTAMTGVSDRIDNWVVAFAISAVGCGLGFCGFVELLLLKGTTGDNRFGHDPLAPVDAVRRSSGWDQQSELEFVPHRADSPAPAERFENQHR
jgi:uncharacterized membrane protein YhaH (DUF805 family)